RFPYRVGRELESLTGAKVNSFNSGVSGSHSMHAVDLLLNKLVRHHPDIAVLCNNINDVNTLLYMGSYWNDNNSRSLTYVYENTWRKAVREEVDASWMGRIMPYTWERVWHIYDGNPEGVFDEWFKIRGRTNKWNVEALEKQYANSLKSFIELCRVWDIEPILMTQAYKYSGKGSKIDDTSLDPEIEFTVPQSNEINESFERIKEKLHFRFNEEIRKVAGIEEVRLIELSMINRDEYLYDKVHYNDTGSIAAASFIAKSLMDEHILQVAEDSTLPMEDEEKK
ncbi:MAG: hypothetical protein IH946_12255, partial [Bacteroidetes bacterium]|nr:hypothetical protein [Bacteroidota bacterium]